MAEMDDKVDAAKAANGGAGQTGAAPDAGPVAGPGTNPGAGPAVGQGAQSGAQSGAGSGAAQDPGLSLLYDVELDATLQFGTREMRLRDVLQLSPGDVVELDRHIAEPVELVVGDRIVARGEVVVASGNFALRITEVATPQLRLESIRCLF